MKTNTWLQMVRMALHYMLGRKLRTGLTTLAIVFGVGMIFAVNLVLPSARNALEKSVAGGQEGVDLNVTSYSGESFLPEQPLQTVMAIDGVEAATGILQRKAILPEDFNASYEEIELVGVDPTTIEQVHEYKLQSGRFLTVDDTGVIVVPKGVAKVGDIFPLVTTNGVQNYQVIGVLADEPTNPDVPRLLINLPDAQTIVNQPGLINLIQVKYADGVNSDNLTPKIEKALGTGFVTNAETDIFAAMQVATAALNVFGFVALFLGGFLIFNTFRTIVIERQHDLGLLRAIGATRSQIMQLILTESLLQGIIGTVIGLAAGYALSLVMTNFLVDVWSQFAGNIQLELELNAQAFGLAIFMGMIVSLVAGFLPARHASHVSPIEALRPATVSKAQQAARWALYVGFAIMALAVILLVMGDSTAPMGAIVFLIGAAIASPGLVVPASRLFEPLLLLWFAREGDMARSNMTRQPGRASITASTLMIGLAVVVLVAAMIKSVDAMTTDMLESSFSSDVVLMPPAVTVYGNLIGADESLKTDLQALPEVDVVSDWRFASSVYEENRLYILGVDPVTYPQVTDLEFIEGNSNEAYAEMASGRGTIINSLTALNLGLEIGDTIDIQTAEGEQTYEVVGIANDLLNLKLMTFMISQDNIATDFHKTESIMYMINLKPDADKDTALANIQAVAADYPQFEVTYTQDYRDEMQSFVSSAVSAYYVLAALILIPAALGLLNTLTINIMERTREIGVVRAVGANRNQVQRMVLAEALLLGLFGAALGVLAGVATSYGVISTFSIIGWSIPYIFPAMGIVSAVVIAILLALFSSILPARNAAKLDIIRALQYE